MPSALAATDAATTPSAARAVWASPLHRGATVALFLSGLGMSAAAPQITLFLVNDLHVSLTTAGLFYLTNITLAARGSFLIGSRSDRSAQAAGAVPLVRAGGIPRLGRDVPGRPGVDAVRDQHPGIGVLGRRRLPAFRRDPRRSARASESPVADGVVSVVRMALTAGWVVGPVLGSLLATAAGPRVMLAATGVCALAQIVLLGFARTLTSLPGPHTPRRLPLKRMPSASYSARSFRRCCRCSRSPGCTCSYTRESRSSTATCRSTCATTCTCRRRSAARSSVSNL